MALTTFNLLDDEVNATIEGERNYVATYQGISDTATDTSWDIINDALVPNRTTSHPSDAGAFPVMYRAKRPNRIQLLHWEIQIDFSTRGTKRHDEYEDDPVLQSPIISTYPIRFSRATMHDKNGDAIVNSAKDIIADVEMDDYRWGLRIQKNFNTIDETQYRDFTNSVNSATFFGLAAKNWKMGGPRTEVKYRGNNTPYYQVTFEFETSSEVTGNWDKRLVDRGIYQIVNGTRTRCTDNEKRPASMPQNLDGGGEQLGPGIEPVNIVPDFELYESKDFGLLGIPTAFPV